MAMAEGERTECAEHPRDEPPADGSLKRAEELKTQANDYFKGASGPDGAEGGWTAAQAVGGCQAPRGTMATRSGSLSAGQALPSSLVRGGGSGWTPDRGELQRSGVRSRSYSLGRLRQALLNDRGQAGNRHVSTAKCETWTEVLGGGQT